MAKPIHHEVAFKGTPDQVYAAYMNAEQRAEYTDGAAEISDEEGGAFSCHDGQIVGRNLELVPGERIVQAWRVSAWPEGLYTTVRFELSAQGNETKLVMDHFGVPDDFEPMIAQGWEARYWGPLAKYLAK